MNRVKAFPARHAALGLAAASLLIMGIGPSSAQAQSGSGGTILKTHRIAADTPVKVKVLQSVTSETAQVGDRLRVAVSSADSSGLPAGTILVGRVTRAEPATLKKAGVLVVQFGIPDQSADDAASDDSPQATAFTDTASLHLVGKSPTSEKSQYTSIGAGAGAIIGLSRKRKIGDAVTGAILGAAGGYAADKAQKHPATDISLPKGSETTIHLDTPLILRTEIIAPY